ncbi:MAG: hypothetical protein LC135_04095 [Phycisphaerae bacterium]|nr:hypothetical protein [Phycisphaerae bacterium]MCZ2399033.1 hypothetical protein [Phycisphaerae bacterium]
MSPTLRTRRSSPSRRRLLSVLALGVAASSGCPPIWTAEDASRTLGVSAASPDNEKPGSAAPRVGVLAGQVVEQTPPLGGPSHRLIEFEGAAAGETLMFRLHARDASGQLLTVALFDEHMCVLVRTQLRDDGALAHALRRDCQAVLVGLAGAADLLERIEVSVERRPGVALMTTAPQAVWLNFAGADELVVGDELPISFAAFDAADLGGAYGGETGYIKQVIVETLRARYADYAVDITTSDDGPPPAEAHATIHFGGQHATLLGKAQWIDRYNSHPDDQAIVYTSSAAKYAGMGLRPDEMGRLLGNTGAHELGHLLGLYHTLGGESIMDASGGVWELAGERRLGRDPLDVRVFPTGFDDAPRVLAETVGLRPGVALQAARLRTSSEPWPDGVLRRQCSACSEAGLFAAAQPPVPGGAAGVAAERWRRALTFWRAQSARMPPASPR